MKIYSLKDYKRKYNNKELSDNSLYFSFKYDFFTQSPPETDNETVNFKMLIIAQKIKKVDFTKPHGYDVLRHLEGVVYFTLKKYYEENKIPYIDPKYYEEIKTDGSSAN